MKNIEQEFTAKCKFDKKCIPELIKVIYSNGKEHLRYQCTTCGKINENSVSRGNRDVSKIPYADEIKLKEYNDRTNRFVSEECSQLAAKAREEHKINRAKFFEEYLNFKFHDFRDFQPAYEIYLKSEFWKIKRNKILARDNFTCRLCEKSIATDVHHLNYQNLGNESDFELLSVCRTCHEKIHNKIPTSNI